VLNSIFYWMLFFSVGCCFSGCCFPLDTIFSRIVSISSRFLINDSSVPFPHAFYFSVRSFDLFFAKSGNYKFASLLLIPPLGGGGGPPPPREPRGGAVKKREGT
jgi:hypothetical protein